MANNDISDVTQDLSSLLSSDERDFLVHNNGDKVKISSLKGKIVGLFFSRSSSSTCLKFIPKLVEIYEQFASIGEFEVVFVSSDENGESFNGYFSKMPWLAVPFSDSASRNRLMELFDLHGVFTLVIFDKNGQFANKDGTWLVLDYGVEGYPFTNERVEFLKEKEEITKKNQTLSSVLVSRSRDYLFSNDGNKISVSELEGKMVGLYFYSSFLRPCLEFTETLTDFYTKLKEKGENFEVVLVPLDYELKSFRKEFEKMPWLALPFEDNMSSKLGRYFDLKTIPTLLIIGQDGKTLNPNVVELIEEYGIQAYPFTPEKLLELDVIEKEKEESQTLESLLVFGEKDFLIENNGSKVLVSEVVGKTVLLYFSVHWCPSRLELMPRLVRIYHELKEKGEAFEVIYISSDCCQSTFDEAFSSMPWLALPFGDKRKRYLERMCKVQTLPTVIAIGSSGKTVNWDAQRTILVRGADAYPFTEEHLKHLEEKAIPNWLPKKLKHELHSQHQHVLTRWEGFNFDGYDSVGNGLSFYCVECNFDLHLECAMVNDEEGKDDQKENHEGLLC